MRNVHLPKCPNSNDKNITQRYKDAVEKEKEAEEERKSEMCNQGVPLKDMSKDEFNSYKRLTQKRYEDNLKANDYQKYVARKNNNVNSSRIAKKRTWDRKSKNVKKCMQDLTI